MTVRYDDDDRRGFETNDELEREYEATVQRALQLARASGVASRPEMLALELLSGLVDERRHGHAPPPPPPMPAVTPSPAVSLPPAVLAPPLPPVEARVAVDDDLVIDLRDDAPKLVPDFEPVWEYDPPAWLDPNRVESLPPVELVGFDASTSGPIDWKGTDDTQRFGHDTVRLPFGAHLLDDFALIERLRDDEHRAR